MIAVSESIRRFKCFFFNDTATTEIYTLSLHDALPIFTVVALQFGALLGGSVIVETVFSWPGAGWLLMQGVYARDLPVVRALVLIIGGTFILLNLLVDVSYRYLDPRIRY